MDEKVPTIRQELRDLTLETVKAGGNLPVVQLENYAITKIDPAELAEVFEANFGGEGITPFDLTQISVGRGGSTLWIVRGVEDGVKSIDGVILYFRNARGYWEGAYNAAMVSPPDCSSQDAVHGNGVFGPGSDGNPSGMCATCPMARFGTATRDGKKMRGQACAQNRFYFVLLPNTVMPVSIKLPPTSRKSAMAYSVELMNHGVHYWKTITEFTLRQEVKGGFPVAVAHLRAVAKLGPEVLPQIEAIRNGMMQYLMTVKVEVASENDAD